jgi:hypothetical protein
MAKKTNEEFEQEVFELVGSEYSLLEEYVDSKTKIKIRHNCKECNNHKYFVSPSKACPRLANCALI